MTAYYNENDPGAAQWLRNLIAAGHIPTGDVDERSIVDVWPDDLKGYVQCHFFAGVAGWPLALRLSGWPDEQAVWTGSCPCQPLSSAGQRKGHADERHLWPAFYSLIAERRPATVIGEQVTSKDGREWLAGVRADLEGLGYAVGAADLCAASVGAPHIRSRLFWVGYPEHNGSLAEQQSCGTKDQGRLLESKRPSATRRLADAPGYQPRKDEPFQERRPAAVSRLYGNAIRPADAEHPERRPLSPDRQDGCDGADNGRQEAHSEPGTCGEIRGVGDTTFGRSRSLDRQSRRGAQPQEQDRGPGVSGFWSSAVWLPCLDGKARRAQPGIFPLAHGVPGRMGRLRAYGNAIVPQVAAEFIKAAVDALADRRP